MSGPPQESLRPPRMLSGPLTRGTQDFKLVCALGPSLSAWVEVRILHVACGFGHKPSIEVCSFICILMRIVEACAASVGHGPAFDRPCRPQSKPCVIEAGGCVSAPRAWATSIMNYRWIGQIPSPAPTRGDNSGLTS